MNSFIHNELIDDFFTTVKNHILPSFILSDNPKIENELSIIENIIFIAKENLKNNSKSEGSNFHVKLKEVLEPVILYIEQLEKDPNNIFEFSSLYNELKSLPGNTSESMVIKLYKARIEKFESITKNHENFNGFSFLKNKLFPKKENPAGITQETWQILAKDALKKLHKDFGFKSVTILGNQPWSEVYEWATDSYKSIKDAQENIGLSQKSAGINNTLNLCYSPDTLYNRRAHAEMLAHEFSNTILLTKQPYLKQKSSWQHEYTHALDNRVGILYLKDTKLYDNKYKHSQAFLSSIELVNNLSDESLPQSSNLQIRESQIWIAEFLSVLISGKNSLEFDAFQKNAHDNFLSEVSACLIKLILPEKEKAWKELSEDNKNNILKSLLLKNLSSEFSNLLYTQGDNFLNENNKNYQFNFDILTTHIKPICNLTSSFTNQNESELTANALKKINENKNELLINLKKLLCTHAYSYDKNKPFFPISKSVQLASLKAITDNKNYWIRPVELIARASENLQYPLLLGTNEFHISNEPKTQNELVPKLDQNERILLISAIQSMANSLELELVNKPENVKSVEKELNYEEAANFHPMLFDDMKSHSTASGDEKKSKTLLNIAKIRVNHKELKIIP